MSKELYQCSVCKEWYGLNVFNLEEGMCTDCTHEEEELEENEDE